MAGSAVLTSVHILDITGDSPGCSRTSQTDDGRCQERKQCFCSDPGDRLCVMFPILYYYQLCKATVVPQAILAHSAGCSEY